MPSSRARHDLELTVLELEFIRIVFLVEVLIVPNSQKASFFKRFVSFDRG